MAYNYFMPNCSKREYLSQNREARNDIVESKVNNFCSDELDNFESPENEDIRDMTLMQAVSNTRVNNFLDYSANEILSLNVEGKYILFHRISDGNQTELSFESRYGDIVAHHWMSKENILVGFSGGYIVMFNIQHHDRELWCLEVPGVGLSRVSLNGTHNSRGGSGTFSCASNKFVAVKSAAFHYSEHTKVACFVDKNMVTLIDLNEQQLKCPELVQVNFMGSEDDQIVLSSDGAMLTITGPHGNLWHYVARHFLCEREKPTTVFSNMSKKIILGLIAQNISLKMVVFSFFCGVLVFSYLGAKILELQRVIFGTVFLELQR